MNYQKEFKKYLEWSKENHPISIKVIGAIGIIAALLILAVVVVAWVKPAIWHIGFVVHSTGNLVKT